MAARIDETDRRMLTFLQQDARMSIRQLSESLHVSRANAYVRYNRLIADGYIRGFYADVAPEAFGLATTAYITVSLRQADWRAIRDRLIVMPEIRHVALVGGDFDVIVLARTTDNSSLRRLILEDILSIPGVLSTRTHTIFDEAITSASEIEAAG